MVYLKTMEQAYEPVIAQVLPTAASLRDYCGWAKQVIWSLNVQRFRALFRVL
jgi:hypothetical protein